ncbi:MAG TPA: hypothetical protein PKD91_08140 [Bacteroidia bacterium]|nr:hypothetical protein [Bacteroidia bacterium]
MIKKSLLSIILIAALTTCIYAQRPPSDPKHENHYLVQKVETDELAIDFQDAHSQQEFTHVELKIKNKTNDYILVKGSEMKFIYPHGTYTPKGSAINKINFTIEPLDSKSKTVKVSGDNRFHVESLKLEMNGFYSVNPKGDIQKAPDFQLPAAKNSFSAGPCDCTLEKSKQTTKETAAEFNCTYKGKNVAFVDPTKLSVKLRDGQEFANNNKKDKGEILMPGDEIKFTAIFNIPGKIADMQFTVLNIVWNDTFVESVMKPLKVGTADFTFDSGVTLLKNK